jgi:DUF438 domain-containing protein
MVVSGESKGPKERVRELIEALRAGASPEKVKTDFEDILGGMESADITEIEDELVREGLPPQEIQRLCDVHLAIFKEAADKAKIEISAGHPIYILVEEHRFVRDVADEISRLLPIIEKVKGFPEIKETMVRLDQLLGHLREYDKHKVREENALFPLMEKHGVIQPPAVMWSEHDQQRKLIKDATKTLKRSEELGISKFKERALPVLRALAEQIPSHFYKEENILYPTALKIIREKEWKEIKASMDDLGYCYFTPKDAVGEIKTTAAKAKKLGSEIVLESGVFKVNQLECVLNSLPVDITFVDDEDTVRYFNQAKDRIFPRTKAIIGRKVQKCHPQKSVDVVDRILKDFRAGRRDLAKFWLHLGEKFVVIQYVAMRDRNGKYVGCLEVSQDIARIQKIQGEKRLLD